jgi:hypothetical protein
MDLIQLAGRVDSWRDIMNAIKESSRYVTEEECLPADLF